ncbi:MAG: hypothetical protein ACHREM_34045, partial [Polyangiales bacterium]
RLYHQGRFEIAPVVTFTQLDEFNRSIHVGARQNYGVTDRLQIGVWGAFGAVNITTGLTDQIDANAPSNNATQSNVPPGKVFSQQVAKISFAVMGQVTATPFRGKMAIFQSLFADVDAYVFAGGGIVGTQEREFCSDTALNESTPPPCSDPKTHNLASQSHLAPTWGLGFNFFINNFMSLGLEYRFIPFAWNRPGFDSAGSDGSVGKVDPNATGKYPDGNVDSKDQSYRFNQMISLSLGFSFPTKPKITD